MVHPSEVGGDTLRNLLLIERVNSGVSVVCCLFIIVTFLFCDKFNKPINRLITFATMGNLMTNVATVIAGHARSNQSSFLCQAQGFLIQMFMAADVLWTLAMACNVYLTFYHKFDATRLRKVEKWYFLACYGIPFVPAFTFIFANSPGKGRIYGDSLLWCWVTQEYDFLRIGTFYGPIWVVIFCTAAIYIRAGREIWAKRRSLQNLSAEAILRYKSDYLNPYKVEAEEVREGTIQETVDIEVTYVRTHEVVDVNVLGRQLTAADKLPHDSHFGEPQYNAEVTAEIPEPVAVYRVGMMAPFPSRPSKPKKSKKPLNTVPEEAANIRAINAAEANRQYLAYQASRAAWGYTKISCMFFLAMLLTWIPSSANRLWSAINDGDVNIALTYIAAFVLPLQGFWNCAIYVITSFSAVKRLFGRGSESKVRDGMRMRPREADHYELPMVSQRVDFATKRNSHGEKRSVDTDDLDTPRVSFERVGERRTSSRSIF